MSSGVTSTGFVPKTFDELVAELIESSKDPSNFGEEFPTTPDSAYAILTNIISGALKDQWDLTQQVADEQNPDKASGKHLNDLAALSGKTRLLSSASNGPLLFTGLSGAVIPSQTAVKSTSTSEIVLTSAILTLNRTICYKSSITTTDIQATTQYTITVNSDVYDFVSSGSPTLLEIVQGLVALIGVQADYTATNDSDTNIIITNNIESNILTTSNSINMTLVEVGSLTTALSVNEGPLIFLAGTLTNMLATPSGISSTINLQDFTLGREEETDEELRVRMGQEGQSSGTATKPSIESSIKDLEGVDAAFIIENTSSVVDGEGRPIKSYELYVDGGDEDVIANELWLTKPVGIETHGDIPKVVIDANGDNQVVNFSRFEDLYAWVRVTYAINSEELFPVDGVNSMKEAVVETGDAHYQGEDFEPNKFYGNLYANVSGISVTSIEIATTALPEDTPSYQTAIIPIAKIQNLLFDTQRVEVIT